MKNISDVDENLAVETKLNIDGIQFYNALSEPFSIHGVFFDDGQFRRLPEEVAKNKKSYTGQYLKRILSE